ncbi:hypothetical protein DICVIV_13530 [Dictyocaulus viviparus]|uniref:Uncharacterized protein n=1 Tax=Dictyocaulus viviparus TaxID=29172 RepID=A0A0D8XA48_DICVI|nr:hypothetical protein DICVIV_13530 [Dictyocaulus viviparus]
MALIPQSLKSHFYIEVFRLPEFCLVSCYKPFHMSRFTHLAVFKSILCSIFLLVASAQHNTEVSKGDKILNFTISGFKLPLPLMYTDDASSFAQFPSASTSEHSAKAFARNLIARAVRSNFFSSFTSELLGKVIIRS